MARLSWEEARAVLRLGSHVSADDIRCAYRQMVKETHPDLNPVKDSEAFCLVREAYLVMLRNAPQSLRDSDVQTETMSKVADVDLLVPVVYKKSHWSRLCQWWFKRTSSQEGITIHRIGVQPAVYERYHTH